MTFFTVVTWLAVLLLGCGSIGVFVTFVVSAIRNKDD